MLVALGLYCRTIPCHRQQAAKDMQGLFLFDEAVIIYLLLCMGAGSFGTGLYKEFSTQVRGKELRDYKGGLFL
jgi:hypothetical protein